MLLETHSNSYTYILVFFNGFLLQSLTIRNAFLYQDLYIQSSKRQVWNRVLIFLCAIGEISAIGYYQSLYIDPMLLWGL